MSGIHFPHAAAGVAAALTHLAASAAAHTWALVRHHPQFAAGAAASALVLGGGAALVRRLRDGRGGEAGAGAVQVRHSLGPWTFILALAAAVGGGWYLAHRKAAAIARAVPRPTVTHTTIVQHTTNAHPAGNAGWAAAVAVAAMLTAAVLAMFFSRRRPQ